MTILKCRKCGAEENHSDDVVSFEHTDCTAAALLRTYASYATVWKAYTDLLNACKLFRERRGTHPGVEHITAEYRPCENRERSYIEEEALLDAAIGRADYKEQL